MHLDNSLISIKKLKLFFQTKKKNIKENVIVLEYFIFFPIPSRIPINFFLQFFQLLTLIFFFYFLQLPIPRIALINLFFQFFQILISRIT